MNRPGDVHEVVWFYRKFKELLLKTSADTRSFVIPDVLLDVLEHSDGWWFVYDSVADLYLKVALASPYFLREEMYRPMDLPFAPLSGPEAQRLVPADGALRPWQPDPDPMDMRLIIAVSVMVCFLSCIMMVTWALKRRWEKRRQQRQEQLELMDMEALPSELKLGCWSSQHSMATSLPSWGSW